ncbi:uncharacterized protein LOC131179465 [Hevea brasiliensis]|uniref:uncharacterized protein LOC131179465 n=1 Tax=Hevea brasiliensis TaxID=3981 RepID=UPI002600608E|nr:uncharacterized protein LOC131179465 [Hevea brasiliensis]
MVNKVYKCCPLEYEFLEDLIEVPFHEFKVILGMDWLSRYQVMVDCRLKRITLRTSDNEEITIVGERMDYLSNVISATTVRRLIKMGCKAYLTHVVDIRKARPDLHDIPIVCDFPNVFPEKLPNLPSEREVEFAIEVIPEALSQMPSYAKFCKDILSKKRRLEDYETVALTEECSAILQNKLPPKLKDPGSFFIPCLIGNMNINKALCDLGVSVSLVPLSICKKLDVGELKPTIISLQLVDRSVKYTVGILENISIKVGDEEVEFNLFSAMKHKLEPDECFKVDIIDKQVGEEFSKAHPEDPLGASIVHSHIVEKENMKIAACAQSLTANPSPLLAQVFAIEELKEEQPKSKLQENTKQVEMKPLPSKLRYAFLNSNFEYLSLSMPVYLK